MRTKVISAGLRQTALTLASVFCLAACSGDRSTSPAAVQPPAVAVACSSPAGLTPSLTEGPYFKANSPERASLLESGIPGTKLVLTGYVRTTDLRNPPFS